MTVKRKRIWVDLLLYPAHTLPTAAAPVLVGAGLAAHDGIFAALPMLVAFLGSWLIHVAGVLTDNHELLRRYPQIAEHPELSTALKERSLNLYQLKIAIAACFVLEVPCALFFLRIGGLPAIALGAIGVLASLGYAGGPLPYTKLGLAEPIFLGMFGVVAVAGSYYAQLAWLHAANLQVRPSLDAMPASSWIIGLPVGALVTNVLLIDDMRDRQFDLIKGWRTLAVRAGVRGDKIAYCALTAFAYLGGLVLSLSLGLGGWAFLPLVTLPLAWSMAASIWTHEEPVDLLPMTPRASLLACAYAGLLAIGLSVT